MKKKLLLKLLAFRIEGKWLIIKPIKKLSLLSQRLAFRLKDEAGQLEKSYIRINESL